MQVCGETDLSWSRWWWGRGDTMNNALARKEGIDASRSCSFRIRKRSMAACGAGERVGVCDDMLARSDAPGACVPFNFSGVGVWTVTCGSATSVYAYVKTLLALLTGLAAVRSMLRRPCGRSELQKDVPLGSPGCWWGHQSEGTGGSCGTRSAQPDTRTAWGRASKAGPLAPRVCFGVARSRAPGRWTH